MNLQSYQGICITNNQPEEARERGESREAPKAVRVEDEVIFQMMAVDGPRQGHQATHCGKGE